MVPSQFPATPAWSLAHLMENRNWSVTQDAFGETHTSWWTCPGQWKAMWLIWGGLGNLWMTNVGGRCRTSCQFCRARFYLLDQPQWDVEMYQRHWLLAYPDCSPILFPCWAWCRKSCKRVCGRERGQCTWWISCRVVKWGVFFTSQWYRNRSFDKGSTLVVLEEL